MTEQLDMKQLTADVEAVGKAFEEFKATNDTRLGEIEKKGAADPVTEEKLAKINDAIDTSQKRLDDFALVMKRRERFAVTQSGETVDLDAKAMAWANSCARKRGTSVPEFASTDLDGYKAAFGRYLRKDDNALTPDEAKALSVGSDPDGGYTVHPDLNGRIVAKVFTTSAMRAWAGIQAIGTDALVGVSDLDEAGAGWVSETAAVATTTTPQFDQWRIPVHDMAAMPKASQRILDDSDFNLEDWLAGKVADRLGRLEATAFVVGNGIGKPRGFLDYADGTTLPGTIERTKTGVNGGFAAVPNGADTLIDAMHNLKAPYLTGSAWFMSRATMGEVRKLKDSNGAMIWQNGIALDQPATLLGYPVVPFDDMPVIATGSLSIAFGNMRETYQIVDRFGTRVLRDPFTAKPFVQFYTTKRVGGDVVNFESLKLVEFSA